MLCRKGIKLERATLSVKEYKEICKELTVSPISEYMPVQTQFKVYSQSEKFLYIPRFFRNVNIESNTIAEGESISVAFEGVLKKETNQIEASDALLLGLKNKGGGILSLPTGFGKTTVALYVLTQLQKKTLIIVHKEFLMNQWIERIQQFIPSAKIGKIQGSVFDIEGKDIVLGMLQSLSMKEYDNTVFSVFGCTIIDETHHICTKTFSKMLLKFSTKYILGLSATLERKDGLTKVIHWFLGDVLYSTERKKSEIELSTHTFKHDQSFPINRMGNANMPEAINILVDIKERNDLICELIEQCTIKNRKILVLSDRRNHCVLLMNQLNHLEKTVGLYLGGMKPDDLKYSESCDVIIGTYSLAHEGLDIPSLDTLLMSTPKSNIIQAVGRILRETPGKRHVPKVIDIVDHWGPFYAQYKKRCHYYTQLGCFDTHEATPTTTTTDGSGYMFLED